VAAVRRGASLRATARCFGVSLRTVQVWVARARGRRLDRVDWSNRPPGCRTPANRTPLALERHILALRDELASPCGAVHRATNRSSGCSSITTHGVTWRGDYRMLSLVKQRTNW